MWVGVQRHFPAAIFLGKTPGTHFIGGWVEPSASLDGCGKSSHHRDSIPGPSRKNNICKKELKLAYIIKVSKLDEAWN
jgi:hypothetical protein